MKKNKLFILIFFFSVLLSCGSKSSQQVKVAAVDSIPLKVLKGILFDGTLNDSMHIKVFFDTGWGFPTISDSLKGNFGSDAQLQIGSVTNQLNEIKYLDKDNHIIKIHGFDIIIDWQFFTGKIIQISYQHKYLKVLDNMEGYDSVKIIKQNDPGTALAIPVTVSLKGKSITEYLMIDTGYNGNVSYYNNIITKYNIKSDGAYFGKYRMANGLKSGFSFPVDTIRLELVNIL